MEWDIVWMLSNNVQILLTLPNKYHFQFRFFSSWEDNYIHLRMHVSGTLVKKILQNFDL